MAEGKKEPIKGLSWSQLISLAMLLALMIGGYSDIKTDIASLQEKYIYHENAIKLLRDESDRKTELFRSENREDHRLLFQKIDELGKYIYVKSK
jgi:hypothetical protein